MKKALMLPAIIAAVLSAGSAVAEEPEAPGTLATSVSLMGPGLRVVDLEIATRFYRDGLGLSLLTRLPLGEVDELIFGFGGGSEPPMLFLVGPAEGVVKRAEPPQDWRGRIVFAVADIDALHAHLKSTGYAPGDIRTHEDSGTRLFMIDDPDGHRVEIVQPAATGEMEKLDEDSRHG